MSRAKALEDAAMIMRAQIPHRNRLWLQGVVEANIGKDVIQWRDDIASHEAMRSQTTTWGGQSKAGKRKARAVMGYQRSLSHEEAAH